MSGNEDSNDELDEFFESLPERKRPVVVRRAKKKQKKPVITRRYDVEVIKATVGKTPDGFDFPIRNVAAYCRVSTDQEAQSTSYELQCRYYTEYISSKEGWLLAGIYADEGISGTQMKKREQLKILIEDCKSGKIDMILTKSISRLSRNVVDCLSIIRELKALSPPVEVYFEKERLSSLDDKTEMILGVMASVAQEEARSISANITWATKKRMEEGTQKIPTTCLLGYESDESGHPIIIEEEAEIVRYIYKNFIKGLHPNIIADRANSKGWTTVMGNQWTGNSIKNILRNEKYCGDVLMQKTFTVDYLTHKTKKNEGERDQFYIADHHDPIVSREVWNQAQKILDRMSYRGWKKGSQQRLIPVEKGILKGFVSINRHWKDISITRLLQATEKVMNGEPGLLVELVETNNNQKESEDFTMSEVLQGFDVIDIEIGKSDSVMTVMGNMLKFNKATATELGYPQYVRMLIKADSKQVAIQSCTEKTRNSVLFSKSEGQQTYAITVKTPAIVVAVRKLIPGLSEKESLSFKGTLFADDRTIIYNLSEGEPVKKRNQKKVLIEETPVEDIENEELEPIEEPAPPKKRGRRKTESIPVEEPVKKRGRKPKQVTEKSVPSAKKRGRRKSSK